MYNSTALPASVRDFQRLTGMDFNQLLSTNPKTDKNELSTSILHLAPSNLSGFNVCKFAGNCKQICLHFSGNPAFKSKYEARINRTKAFFTDRNKFIELLILSILRQYKRNNYNKVGIRLNGTSDILYENIRLNLPDYLANCIHRKYGLSVNSGPYENIFMLFRLNNLEVQFYDYTKTPRDYSHAIACGYHLTFSYDGKTNKVNHKHCIEALDAGLSIAAAFDIKKGESLPASLYVPELGRRLTVIDGDLSDERFNDPEKLEGVLVGLRYKRATGRKATKQDIKRFCIA